MRWVGHVAHKVNSNIVLMDKSEVKRPLGRPGRWVEHEFKMDL
jgi:hypothetical protein